MSSAKNLRKPWTFERPLCKEIGGEVFFIDDFDDPRGMDTNSSNVQIAQRFCFRCEHQVDCAEWGILNEEHGMWGGLTPRQRREIRRQRRIYIKENRSA